MDIWSKWNHDSQEITNLNARHKNPKVKWFQKWLFYKVIIVTSPIKCYFSNIMYNSLSPIWLYNSVSQIQ